MPYNNINLRTLVWTSKSFAPYDVLYNDVLIKYAGENFQTQAARDTYRRALVGCLQIVADNSTRFPDNSVYVFVQNPAIGAIWAALLKATDTKNRVIETEEENRPTTAEVLNATRRVDDASVAIREETQRLIDAMSSGTGLYDREAFERASGYVWEEAGVQPAA